MTDEITRLRKLQSTINATIDHHVMLLEKGEEDEMRVSQSQRDIRKAISDLDSEVLEPIHEIHSLGLSWMVPLTVALAVRMDIFTHVTKNTTLDDLVKHTKADPDLLLRILRLLTTYKFLGQEQNGSYSSTRISEKLRLPVMEAWMKINAIDHAMCYNHIVPFLIRHDFQDPNNIEADIAKEGFGKSFFEFINETPERSQCFAKSMQISDMQPSYREAPIPFPSDLFQKTHDTNTVTMVDVGGGHGQAMEKFLRRHPDLPGRIILQDLPSVIESFNDSKPTDSRVEGMSYDFFTPQPIKGARYYYFRRVIHDWSDADSIKILSRVREAMDPISSRVWLAERIIPDRDVERPDVLLDMLMMCLSGKERDLSQWNQLCEKAGLKIVDVHRAKVGSHSIIELAVDENWTKGN